MTPIFAPKCRTNSRKTLLVSLMLALPVHAFADEPKPGTIQVSATGTASVAPDMAIINLSVVREAETARTALSENTEAMSVVLAALKTSGIEDRDLQTSNFNIQPKYFYPKVRKDNQQEPPRIVGYTVSNSLTVRVRDLTQVGTILDQAVTLGVNSGGGITFTSDKPDETIEKARKSAMGKAIAKATTLTEAAGVELGRIVDISETTRGRPRPRRMARMQADSMEAAPVPVAAGENNYSVTVNVRWELAQ